MLTEIGLFRTPEDWDEVMHWINQHNPEDRAHLVTAAAMAWNLAAKLTDTIPESWIDRRELRDAQKETKDA